MKLIIDIPDQHLNRVLAAFGPYDKATDVRAIGTIQNVQNKVRQFIKETTRNHEATVAFNKELKQAELERASQAASSVPDLDI